MSDIQILTLLGIAFISAISYSLGHRKGINNTVDFLENKGILIFEE